MFAAGQLVKAALPENAVDSAHTMTPKAAEAAAAAESKHSHRIVHDLLGQLHGHRQLRPVRELTETVATLLPSEEP
ncbi:hypothetical protein ATK36_5383 [Amycolatopsis sulphurea]|uniref:Uncharacterized protein n=1 Tax=Amycolatopsis sulphurea TaxID=76022 RepID=A0A2A9FIA7_9PSEU|nr:hypothetical protein [Amycolatopsis sulphurea]PFG50175.1 hypothetical protein ATK36_5383 [Amycolatopsis sulphurea]